MDVGEMMTREVVTVRPEVPLKEVAVLLVERRISGVPVVDAAGGLLGVVSEADFVAKEVAVADGLHEPKHHLLRGEDREAAARLARGRATTAGEAMTSPPITVTAETPLADAARLMQSRNINRLPVIDGDLLVGIISRADIVRAFARDDDQVEHDVRAALRAVDGLDISVRNGVVTLAGTVSHPTIVPTIATLVGSIPGVTTIDTVAVAWREPAGV